MVSVKNVLNIVHKTVFVSVIFFIKKVVESEAISHVVF